MTPSLPAETRAAILTWFELRGRTLPFRGARDPYAILVSETMAQQTQIARVGQHWIAFMDRFPTVEALAQAGPAEVLRAWRGLGYNRRAINLWRAARAVVSDHGGNVPDDLAALQRLPGVGPYTGRAVAALAFGLPVGAVDTNVRRVLSRVVAGTSAMPERDLQRLADEAVPAGRAGDWTHALMDLGATICRPSRPECPACPARPWCRYGAALSEVRPVANQGLAAIGRPAHGSASKLPFRRTSRWLRGRLLDRLRDGGDGWVVVEPALGDHDGRAIDLALGAMATDGLLERHPEDPWRARLPRS